VNRSVSDLVPLLKGSGYDGVSIKNVLQMSSGVYFNEDYGDFNSDINRFGRVMALGGSFDEFAASLMNERVQGTYMHYVSIDTHVLGMVLRAATGRSIVDYFDEKLWSRLGTDQAAIYLTDTTGEPMVLGGLNLISRDYARLGTLYRDFGVINGEQIIPAQWIEESTTPDAPHLMPGERDSSGSSYGYGYQWWIPEQSDGEFMARGIYGQYIYINRKADVVIVKNSADRNFMANDYESSDITVAAFRAISGSLSID
jgi:CubicO group peptidase (beta-lactamase class C family)